MPHVEAIAYARWAGLRLISEEEHQVAGRGDLERAYPWGDEYGEGHANGAEARRGGTAPVGSFPGGAAWLDPEGRHVPPGTPGARAIHDLCGNVWEWTRSPYSAYPEFKALDVKIQGAKEKLTPEFDANNRVSVSGSFGLPALALRLTTRRGTARWQTTSGLGLRCSASTVPGLDVAPSILRWDLPPPAWPDDVTYVPDLAVAIDRWQSERGTAKPEGYRLITAYDHLTFIPVEESPFSGLATMKSRSTSRPLELGVLSTTLRLVEPDLGPGTYTLSWRAGGEPEEAQDGQPAPPPLPFDPLQDTLLFRTRGGELVGWLPCDEPAELREGRGHVDVHLRPLEVLTTAQLDAQQVPRPAATIVAVHARVAMNKPNKAFGFELPLAVAEGTVDATWRRSEP